MTLPRARPSQSTWSPPRGRNAGPYAGRMRVRFEYDDAATAQWAADLNDLLVGVGAEAYPLEVDDPICLRRPVGLAIVVRLPSMPASAAVGHASALVGEAWAALAEDEPPGPLRISVEDEGTADAPAG